MGSLKCTLGDMNGDCIALREDFKLTFWNMLSIYNVAASSATFVFKVISDEGKEVV